MSDLIERAKDAAWGISLADSVADFDEGFDAGWNACAQSERTRIAADLEALSQKTPVDAMVTALLEYADKLRKSD